MLRGPVLLYWVDAGGAAHETHVVPAHVQPMRALPFMFWFQFGAGVPAWRLGSWVWALRLQDGSACMLALAGCLLLTTTTVAVYSTRELALPCPLFRTRSAISSTLVRSASAWPWSAYS